MEAHPQQISQRKKLRSQSNKYKLPSVLSASKNYHENLSNTIPPFVGKKSIWESIRIGNESPQTIQKIKDKANRIGPAFNKGPIMYINSSDDLHTLGKKV